MALTVLFTPDRALQRDLERALRHAQVARSTPSWAGFQRVVRERPILTAVLDESALPAGRAPEDSLGELRAQFPNLGLVLVSRRHDDPVRLFRLGRAGVTNLILLGVEDLGRTLPRALHRASSGGATAVVTRAMAPYLPRRELEALRIAMDGVHHRWSAEEFAEAVGLSRPFLSERLKASRLPSAGHLLIWVRLLHAGFWLEEPGRTGESVSRQLEYSSGAAFRRALKLYTGATPTEITLGGGLRLVLERFGEACGLRRSRPNVA